MNFRNFLYNKNTLSSFVSISIHIMVFVFVILISGIDTNSISFGSGRFRGTGEGNKYISADFRGAEINKPARKTKPTKKVDSDKIITRDKSAKPLSKVDVPEDSIEHSEPALSENGFYEYSSDFGDSTNLDTTYIENSYGINMNYPSGWQFMQDNDKSNKLDAINFWAPDALGNIMAVEFEVQNKDYFIPSRFKNKTELDDFEIYYNEPEEMENYVNQKVYVRTDIDVDFLITLRVKGKTEFKALQPTFFGMVKSLKFGNTFF